MFNSKANKIKAFVSLLILFISTFSFSQKEDKEIKFLEKRIENHLASTKRILIKKGLDEIEINKILKNEEENIRNQFEEEIKIKENFSFKEEGQIIEYTSKIKNARAVPCTTQVPPAEKAALIAFLASTQKTAYDAQTSWTNKTNWDPNKEVRSYYWTNPANGNYEIDPDGWFGITVSSNCRVTAINLPSNNLYGKIPDLSALTNFKHFEFVRE